MKSVLRNLMLVYLAVLVAVWGAMQFDTGQSWWVSLFLFSPRWIVAVPWLLLFPVTLFVHFRAGLFYFVHLGILLFVILDFRWSPVANATSQLEHVPSLRVLTCNLGEGASDIDQLVQLIRQHQVDAVVLQECSNNVSLPLFQSLGWDYQQHANLAIGTALSCGPLQLLSKRGEDGYGASVAVGVEILLRSGLKSVHNEETAVNDVPHVVRLISVHLPTFRPAFEKAEQFDFSGEAEFSKLAELYRSYAADALADARADQLPTILAGDFNVPVDSPFYRDYWQPFQNALSLRGRGLCYTKFTRFHGVRIDHVLADEYWAVEKAEVGPSLGGDHRPVIANLRLIQVATELPNNSLSSPTALNKVRSREPVAVQR